jgi:multisubunit Na+/H+ antiporter MnhE subunit
MAKKPIKRSPASLFGGILIAVAIFVVWMLVMENPSVVEVLVGLVLAAAVGVWTRLANL